MTDLCGIFWIGGGCEALALVSLIQAPVASGTVAMALPARSGTDSGSAIALTTLAVLGVMRFTALRDPEEGI